LIAQQIPTRKGAFVISRGVHDGGTKFCVMGVSEVFLGKCPILAEGDEVELVVGQAEPESGKGPLTEILFFSAVSSKSGARADMRSGMFSGSTCSAKCSQVSNGFGF